MVKVKVCGFTRAEDIRAAIAADVDAFGFNFAHGPRCITAEQAQPLVALLSPFHVSVALFVDADYDSICRSMERSRCRVVQLHGQENPDLAERLHKHFPVIKAFRIRDAESIHAISDYPADAYLLDAYVPGQAGGTGESWDLSLLQGSTLSKPIILAGGLRPENLGSAIAQVPHCVAVDCASGVESAPAEKDAAAMQAFVRAAKRQS